jgi:hypothetical protein
MRGGVILVILGLLGGLGCGAGPKRPGWAAVRDVKAGDAWARRAVAEEHPDARIRWWRIDYRGETVGYRVERVIAHAARPEENDQWACEPETTPALDDAAGAVRTIERVDKMRYEINGRAVDRMLLLRQDQHRFGQPAVPVTYAHIRQIEGDRTLERWIMLTPRQARIDFGDGDAPLVVPAPESDMRALQIDGPPLDIESHTREPLAWFDLELGGYVRYLPAPPHVSPVGNKLQRLLPLGPEPLITLRSRVDRQGGAADVVEIQRGPLSYVRGRRNAVLRAQPCEMPVVESGIPVEGLPRDWHEGQPVRFRFRPAEGLPEILRSGPYQDVARQGPSVLVQTRAVSSTRRPRLEPLHRRATLMIESDAPAIRTLAHEAAGDAADPHRVLIELAETVRQVIRRPGGRPLASALEALESRHGDCSEQAYLLCALARARGIPATVGIGLVLHDGAFNFHAWTIARVDDAWRPYDPTRRFYGALPPSYLLLGTENGDNLRPPVLGAVLNLLSVKAFTADVDLDRQASRSAAE